MGNVVPENGDFIHFPRLLAEHLQGVLLLAALLEALQDEMVLVGLQEGLGLQDRFPFGKFQVKGGRRLVLPFPRAAHEGEMAKGEQRSNREKKKPKADKNQPELI